MNFDSVIALQSPNPHSYPNYPNHQNNLNVPNDLNHPNHLNDLNHHTTCPSSGTMHIKRNIPVPSFLYWCRLPAGT